MSKNKTIKQVIEEASAGRQRKVKLATSGSFSTTDKIKGQKSGSFQALLKEATKGKKHQELTQDKMAKQSLKKLRDSLSELQSSYGDLNELFNNTVNAQDSTIASLLQDLRYTVSRLDKADFSLKYDIGSGSLFVDGEDSISVSTPDVLSMLSYLTSLFPDKSISLSIDGDADYTDGAALAKLSELNGGPAPSVSAVPPVSPQEGSDIDEVLGGLPADSKRVQDAEMDAESRFVCTYKDDTYSIWDKQLGVLVKVVTTPKEADAMLQGLIAGVSSISEPVVEEPVVEEGELPEGGFGDSKMSDAERSTWITSLMTDFGIDELTARGLAKAYAVKTMAELEEELEVIFKDDIEKMSKFYDFKTLDDFKESLARKK